MNTLLAVELSIPAVNRLLVLQEDLDEPLRQLGVDVRWTPPEQFRLCIKDFGELDDANLPRLKELLQAYAEATHAFQVQTRGASFYPSDEAARMLYCESRDSSGIMEAIQTNVEKAAGHIGFRKDTTPWRPATLIGRLRHEGRRPDLRGVLNNHRDLDAGQSTVRELQLIRSSRVGGQARVRTLARFELGTGR